VIARIGDLALALGEDLESLEVNPLLADGARIEALDAVVTWREHADENRLHRLVGVPHPIVGFNRSPGVVAAVTNAGGFGVLGASAYTPAELDAQLTWIDEQTEGKPYGVDLLVPEKFATGDPGNLVASLRAQIPDGHLAFVAGSARPYGIPDVAGNPEHDEIAASLNPDGAPPARRGLPPPDPAHRQRPGPAAARPRRPGQEAGRAVAALVGQPKHAVRQIEAGVDLLIAQGTEAGGHTGTIATMVLTPEIVDIAGGRPVLAAGGIASGRQMAAALALGAAGVWCGSVWLSSEEDVANQAIKAKFLASHQLGHGALADQDRQARPPAAQRLARGVGAARQPGAAALPLQPMLVNEAWQRIDAAARTGHEGALRLESFFVGQVVGSFEQIRPAGEITRRSSPTASSGSGISPGSSRHEPAARRSPHAREPPSLDPRTPVNHPSLDPRTPVVVGVGQASERLGEPGYLRRSPVDLAADAAADALADTGAEPAAVAAAIEVAVGIRQFENSHPRARAPLGRSDNYPRSVAGRIGATPARAVLEVSGGQAPQHLVNEFAAVIARGGSEVTLIFGSEAISTVEHFARAQDRPDFTEHAEAAWKTAGTGWPG
jgi:Dioxygenases related to 2-nitropropane dioxygenase